MVDKNTALMAIRKFSHLDFFDRLTEEGREEVADTLMDLVNMLPGNPRERNRATGQQIPYVTPEDRLKRFTRIMSTKVTRWPGLAQMVALYNNFYVPANPDLVTAIGACDVPGFTAHEYADNVDAMAEERAQIAAAAEPLRLPAPRIPKELAVRISEVLAEKRGV